MTTDNQNLQQSPDNAGNVDAAGQTQPNVDDVVSRLTQASNEQPESEVNPSESRQGDPDQSNEPADEQFNQFAQQFQEFFGFKPDELKTQLDTVKTQQQTLETAQYLEKAWGVTGPEFEKRLGVVEEYAKGIEDPALQAAFSNPKGIEILYAAATNSGVSVPTLDRSTQLSNRGPKTFTQAEIDALYSSGRISDPAVNEAVMYAYRNGLVK